MEGIGWWEGIHRIPAGVNSTLDCVPQLPNEALMGRSASGNRAIVSDVRTQLAACVGAPVQRLGQ